MNENIHTIGDYSMKIPHLINGWEPDLDCATAEDGTEYEIKDDEYDNYHKALGKVGVDFFNENYTPTLKKVFPNLKVTFSELSTNGPWGVITELVMNTNILTKDIQSFITSRISKEAFEAKYSAEEIQLLNTEGFGFQEFQDYLYEANKSYEGFISAVPQDITALSKEKVWWWKYNNVFGFLCQKVKLPYAECLTEYLLENDPYMSFISKVEKTEEK